MVTYFNLQAPDSDRLLADHMEGTPAYEIEHCSRGHLAVYRRISDLALQLKHDNRDETMVWPWFSGGCVIHEQLLTKFEEQKFTGYRLRPATVRFRDGARSRDYREVVVTGWAGIARPESGIQVLEKCPACAWKKYSGLRDVEQLIQWDQWTGEDFFKVWPASYVLITERVAELLLKLHIKSFTLQGLEDVPAIVRESGFTVGRLSDVIPEDLALKYGKPLGLE
jgi:hypothetical protein